jgi:hypothetical protein
MIFPESKTMETTELIIFAFAALAATSMPMLILTSISYSAYANSSFSHHHHHHNSNLKCTPTLIHLTDRSVTSIVYACNISIFHQPIVRFPNSVAHG